MKRVFLTATLFVAVVLTLCGCFANKEEQMRNRALPFYNEALDYFLSGQLSLARDKALLAIEKYPHFVEAHILYQRIRAMDKETDKLIKEYRKLMNDNPNDPIYIYLYGRILDDLEEQERLYKKITDIDKNCSWGYFGLGWIYFKWQRFDDAIEHFDQAIKLDPLNSMFYLDIGAVYYMMKHNREAEEKLLKAVEIAPKLVDAWLDLGTVYYQRADFEKAVEALRKYVNLYPAAPDKEKVKRLILQMNGGKV
jgi:tetratricopeptide (TPR) repeat protein